MRRKFYFTEEHPGQKGDVGCGESANRIERVPNRCGSRWSPHLTNYTPNPYQFSKESTKDTKKCRGDRPVAPIDDASKTVRRSSPLAALLFYRYSGASSNCSIPPMPRWA